MRAVLLFLLLASSALAGSYPGSPAAVVAAYIEADGEGRSLDSDTCAQVLRYTTWEDAPGWDSFKVIQGYDIGEVATDGNKASVQITYRVLGELSGLAFAKKAADETVSFELAKTKGKWKIDEPQLAPHLTTAAALAVLKSGGAADDPAGKASLQALRALD